ncbi:MAG TPA: type II toxin-antitoxin system VapC family toxin [Solirubrobacterales bacterium]|nr:type II toxin-antitoxin system VapC family toxin [Solirubrobacterales bacterium]
MERKGQDRRRLRRAARRSRRLARHAVLSLLLDTHVVLWWMAGEPDRIGEKAREAIGGKDRIVISAVVIWEVAIKRRLGKLDTPSDLLEQLERAGVDLLPITARHADRVGTLPMRHRDPFDRVLVAQAEIEGLTLVSADQDLHRYGIEVLW